MLLNRMDRILKDKVEADTAWQQVIQGFHGLQEGDLQDGQKKGQEPQGVR